MAPLGESTVPMEAEETGGASSSSGNPSLLAAAASSARAAEKPRIPSSPSNESESRDITQQAETLNRAASSEVMEAHREDLWRAAASLCGMNYLSRLNDPHAVEMIRRQNAEYLQANARTMMVAAGLQTQEQLDEQAKSHGM